MTFRNDQRPGQRGFTLIELLIVVAIIGIISAILIPNLLDSLHKAKQKVSVADIRNIGTAWFSWMTDQVSASAAGQATVYELDWDAAFSGTCNAAALAEMLEGGAAGDTTGQFYLQQMPRVDGWENTLTFGVVAGVTCGDGSTYKILDTGVQTIGIRSLGRDNAVDDVQPYVVGAFPVTDYDCDIVWADGYFVRIPGGTSSSTAKSKKSATC